MALTHKIISGGQTGADRTGLECAKVLGLETGGTAPKGWKTEDGPDPSLVEFGLTQSDSSDYAPRTRANVRDSDVTLWFGNCGSPGYWCTKNAAVTLKKPFYANPYGLQLQYICNTYPIVNIAGNRKSKNPEVVEMVKGAFKWIAKYLDKPEPNF